MIKLDQVNLQYSDGRSAVKNLTLEMGAPGEKIALLGENGAGKSTLFLALTGLLPAHSGKIEIDGLSLNSANLRAIRRKVGMVFQNPDDQIFSATVGQDLAFGPINMHLSPEEVALQVDKAAEAMHIKPLLNRFPRQLSSGEKRRSAIAGVLAMNPEIILLDEPTSGLDPKMRRNLASIISKLPQFCLIATHDLEFASQVCTRAIVLKNGQLQGFDRLSKLLSDHEFLQNCGLE